MDALCPSGKVCPVLAPIEMRKSEIGVSESSADCNLAEIKLRTIDRSDVLVEPIAAQHEFLFTDLKLTVCPLASWRRKKCIFGGYKQCF